MRILYLCHRIPYPPNKGEKIRAFHELKALAGRHDIDLFTLIDDQADLQWRDSLNDMCGSVFAPRLHQFAARVRALPYLVTKTPLTLPCFWSNDLARAVSEAGKTRTYDRVVVYCSAMAPYAKLAGSVPLIVDLVDVDSDKWRQYASCSKPPMSWVYRREAWSLRAYERAICRDADAVVVTTEREARLVREIDDRATVQVIPNGVDTEYFSQASVPRALRQRAIVFTGDMAYYANEQAVMHFALNVFPKIKASVADAKFLIVGRDPGPAVRELTHLPGVEVTGFVPDVRAYLARASVAVAPFQIAAGIQNKILEAMAYGLPVVATSRAAQGLTAEVRRLVRLGDTAEELAAHCIGFLTNVAAATDVGDRGRLQVASAYSWGTSLARFMDLVEAPGRQQSSARALSA
jgi:sugar transferase (PEP-CTERM/EpsH1 system associated)